MTFIRSVVLSIALLIQANFLFAQLAPQDSLQTAISDLIQDNCEQKLAAGMSAGFALTNGNTWIGFAGYSNLDAQAPVDATTLFRTASIAKPMTAVAIMQLVENGLIDLDRPIFEYLPAFPISSGEKITVRHLLSHSSGVGGYATDKAANNKEHFSSLADAMKVFQNRKLLFEPGEGFTYSSYGYVVLGWVIEQVTGITYESYMEENIWKPSGMNNTGVEHSKNRPSAQSQLYHFKPGGKLFRKKSKLKHADWTDLSDRIPGGGFYYTIEDLLKFGQAVLNYSLISRESSELMWTNTGLKPWGNPYGLGWYLYGKNPKYGPVYGHTGGQMGASGMFMILPESNLVVCTLANTSGALQAVTDVTVSMFGAAELAPTVD